LPSFVMAIVCGCIMLAFGDRTEDPRRAAAPTASTTAPADPGARSASGETQPSPKSTPAPPKRFSSPQNVLGMLFLLVFGLNMLIMAIDFPRFTVIALILLVAALGFF